MHAKVWRPSNRSRADGRVEARTATGGAAREVAQPLAVVHVIGADRTRVAIVTAHVS